MINTKYPYQQDQNGLRQIPKNAVISRQHWPHRNFDLFKSSQGFTLIEILISLTLFVFGALGLIALQIKSIQMSHQAHLNSTAMLLLEDMSGRIRTNPIAARTGHYLLTQNTKVPVHCEISKCTSLEMAQYDKRLWLERIKKHLPSAKASIRFINNRYILSVYWQNQHLYKTCTQESANTKKLNCLSLEVHL